MVCSATQRVRSRPGLCETLSHKKKSKEVAWDIRSPVPDSNHQGWEWGGEKEKTERREERKGAFLSVVFKEANVDIFTEMIGTLQKNQQMPKKW